MKAVEDAIDGIHVASVGMSGLVARLLFDWSLAT